MYHSAKSDIIHHLEKEAETLTDRIVDNAIIYDCVVQDGGRLIHQLLPHAVGTFEEFTQMRLFSHLQSELRRASRLDVVWDTYQDFSIKGGTRNDRGHGVRLKVGPKVRIPKDWCGFLRNSNNKMELFRYLANEVMLRFHTTGDLYITHDDGKLVGHKGPGVEMLTTCNQEEADIRIVIHVLHALTCGASNVLVKTSDSDVIVILVHHFPRFNQCSKGCSVMVRFGTGKAQKLINVRELNDGLGPDRSKALPLFMALTGCDSTSSLKGHSKGQCFNF